MDKISTKEIPENPGIYIFKDKYNDPLYVGKAKNLRKRVPSYFRENTSWKIKRLISEAIEISFVTSKNEADALLAEYSFIQQYKPKYNVRLKDDKSYPYVTVTNETWPRAYVSRSINEKNINFGPFPFIGAARRSLDHLINIFPVRTCTKNVFERHQKLNKPCLLFDINKCSGPCVNAIDQESYKNMLENIENFYSGKSDMYVNNKIADMKKYSANQEYEKANEAKKLIEHLENARSTQTLMVSNTKSVDVIGIDVSNLDVVISCLLIRNGRIIGEVKKTFEPIDTKKHDEYLPQIILSIFSENQPSEEILVSHSFPFIELIQEQLSEKWGRKIELKTPKQGWKKELLNTAIIDAKELRRVVNFRRRTDLEFRTRSLEQLKNKLNLTNVPYRIEAYDISNLGPEYRVGSMVVMEDGLSKPSMYRKFHIKSFQGQDDFKSMEEVLFRRLRRLTKNNENDPSFRRKPDLILIDGGKGQLSSAKGVLDHLQLEIDVVGLAKREEEIFKPFQKESILLNKNSEALFTLQNIRDEAHRFAINENRRLRIKNFDKQTLLNIEGVGTVSSKKILDKYKSIEKLSKATYEELEEILTPNIARKIINYFNNI
ncbi:MAG: excinuclease ABC subunit UvrC [Candidatus Actinomarina sp.]|jgi:excinuclease ABC subunit C|nr:excinuclease ABC subunit UvrC [Candidatus Actinomarina sp.]MBL6837132.1 excinuclease ABC subunit UvrC [Candidatus Actinomarina sp.]